MITRFVEATDGTAYGKFLICRMDQEELHTRTAMPEHAEEPELAKPFLLTHGGRRRFNDHSTFVIDLQRGTGFAWPLASAGGGRDGAKCAIVSYAAEKIPGLSGLVCPLYLSFLIWLHEDGRWAMGAGDILDIPSYVDLRR